MARKVGKKNVVKADLCMYDYVLLGESKIGKTTLANQIGNMLYGDEGILLLELGREFGTAHLDCFYEDVPTWDDLEEIIDVLIKERNTTFKDTRMVAIDSLDELARLAEEKTIEIYNDSVDINKQVNSITACMGGFNRGVLFASDLIVKTVFKLKDAGYSIFFIGHVKNKTLVDPINGVEFSQITCNVNKNYFNAIRDKVHVCAVSYVEREYDNLQTEQRRVKGFDGKLRNQEVQTSDGILSQKRVIVFRNTDDYTIDASSRFANIKEKIDFDAKGFIDAITDAIKIQVETQRKQKITETELNDIAEKQHEEKMEQVDKFIKEKIEEEQKQNEEEEKERVLQQLMGSYKTMSREKKSHIKQVLTNNGATKLQELSVEVLKTLL